MWLQYLKNLITYPQVDGTPYSLDLCYSVAGVTSPAFPTMAFQFSGTDSTTSVYLSLSQSNLFVQIDAQNPDIYCLAMASTRQFSIIGNIQQSDHHIEYDVANKRIGWATTTCWDVSFPNFWFLNMTNHSSPASSQWGKRRSTSPAGPRESSCWVGLYHRPVPWYTNLSRCMAFKSDKNVPNRRDYWQIELHWILLIDKGWHRPSMARMTS